MNHRSIPLIVFLLITCQLIKAQDFIEIWPKGKKPNWNGKTVKDSVYDERFWKVGNPGIYAFLVPKAENKRTAVLICPGGGYERVSHIYNGFNFAKWFNTKGINAFVLVYRLPTQEDLQNRETAPLMDAQRAMRLIRSNAIKWEIDSSKIGVMGISAGGHLASTLGTHFDNVSSIKDSLDRFSYRPDFMILISPVISMGQYGSPGTRRNFLGADTTDVAITKYSNEAHVSSKTPATFLAHAQNDNVVDVRNSLKFYDALIDNKIPASIHVFPTGGHTLRLQDNPGSSSLWYSLLQLWLEETIETKSIKNN